MHFLPSQLYNTFDIQDLFSALYGTLFTDNKVAAFSNMTFWFCVGRIISYGYSSYLCMVTKLYIIGGLMVIGLCLYTIIEFRLYTLKHTAAENKNVEIEIMPPNKEKMAGLLENKERD